MSVSKTAMLLCTAAVLMIAADSAQAADGSQPSLAGKWSGQFKSDVDGYEGLLGADLKQSDGGQLTGILPYMEQENLYKLRVAAGDVNNDGTFEILGMMEPEEGVTLFMTINGAYLPAEKDGELPMLVGTYEVISVNDRGDRRMEDAGTFGIIAVLIGL